MKNKITIDLNDLLGDEDGAYESLGESIKRQVVDKLSRDLKAEIKKEVEISIQNFLQDEVLKESEKLLPTLMEECLNAEYRPVDSWGSKGKLTTFKEELVKSIGSGMVYKKCQWDSDKNAFSKIVDSIIVENIKSFKEVYDKQVNQTFINDAFDYATKQLKEKLKIK
jgi:hypothetical protein